MKKLVLLLVISLGLVSVANAESVCKEKEDSYFDYGIAELIDDKYNHRNNLSKVQERKNRQLQAAWSKLLLRHYIGELKSSDKESLCLSMYTVKTDYLKTTLTPQDIERFEKYLIKNESYESYERNKDDYLNALKFLKHFNKLEYWYSKHNKDWMEWQLVRRVKNMTNHNDNPKVYAERFVYGKSLGNPFEFQRLDGDYSLNGMKRAQRIFVGKDGKYCTTSLQCYEAKDLKYIIQWAESKIKEAK